MDETQLSLRENLGRLPRGAWILFFGTFLNKFGTFVLPFLAIYMTGLGFSTFQAGLAIGAYGIGTLIACLLGGYLADNLGRRRTIVLSMFSAALVMLCLSQARTLPAIVSLSCLAGLTGELYRPASSALLADLIPAGQRVTAFAAYRMSFNAGWAFGPAVAGLLAQHSFLWLFIGDAATSLLYACVAWFALPSGLATTRTGSSPVELFRTVRENPRFLQVLSSSLIIGLVFVQVFSTMSLEITQAGYSPEVYGLLISMNGLLVVLFELPLTTITKRLPTRKVMAFGYLLIGFAFATNLLVRTIPLLIVTMALLTLGEMIAMPVSGAYVADLAPEQKRGLYMGAYGMMWALAFVFGPAIGMQLYTGSPVALWGGCGVMGVIAATIILSKGFGKPTLWPLKNLGFSCAKRPDLGAR